ncbi:MAG: hypothetical protein JXQ72_00955 [Anaerolineae bacterium]|nr:hypothetical protein [Anaerolineae bacterium]
MVTVRRSWLLLSGVVLGLVCYYLPWYTHETAGFTMHAYDLAEWSSLHPAVRSSSPPMLTSFLLRAPQWALIVALALAANGLSDPRARWVWRGLAALVALRFVPPTDFFSSATDDPNYRQMALLTGLSLGAVGITLFVHRLPDRWRDWLIVAVLAAGAVAGWWGLSRAGILLDNFKIDVQIGSGAVGFAIVTGLMAGLVAAGKYKKGG